MDRELFFSVLPSKKNIALAACAVCPVRQKCLDYAMENQEEHGVWGGTTPSRREQMGMTVNRKDWVAVLRRCGSQEGIENHRRVGTELCAACKDVPRRRENARKGIGRVA